MIGYIAFFVTVVLVSAGAGAIALHLIGTPERGRRGVQGPPAVSGLVTDTLDGVHVTRPALDPFGPTAPGWDDDSLALVRWTAYHQRDPRITPVYETAASTGDLSFIRQQIDLDNFALWMEKEFYRLHETVRSQFTKIGSAA